MIGLVFQLETFTDTDCRWAEVTDLWLSSSLLIWPRSLASLASLNSRTTWSSFRFCSCSSSMLLKQKAIPALNSPRSKSCYLTPGVGVRPNHHLPVSIKLVISSKKQVHDAREGSPPERNKFLRDEMWWAGDFRGWILPEIIICHLDDGSSRLFQLLQQHPYLKQPTNRNMSSKRTKQLPHLIMFRSNDKGPQL